MCTLDLQDLWLQFQVKTVDVEEELDKTLKELDIDHWVNKRVPRPPGWEE